MTLVTTLGRVIGVLPITRAENLVDALGGPDGFSADTPVSVLQILDTNGLDDALFALRSCEGVERFARLLACEYAARVLPLYEERRPGNDLPRRALDMARRFARGEVSQADLEAAWNAAWPSEWVNVPTSRAQAAARAEWAARATAGQSALDAVWMAASSARAAAAAAGGDAAREAEHVEQERLLREALAMAAHA